MSAIKIMDASKEALPPTRGRCHMFATAIPGTGYGYGGQQIGGYGGQQVGPQAPYGGFFAQPGVAIGTPFSQQQLGGQPQFGGQLQFGGPSGQAGFGYGTQQNVLPLTFGPGTVPFIGQPTQVGWGQFGGSQFGQPQPQIYVVPVLTPQGWIGQLVIAAGQPLGAVGQAFGGQQFGPGLGGVSPIPWIGGGQSYGYGVPQMGQQPMGQPFLAGGVPGGYGGGYLPLQLQQIPQAFLPVVPTGGTPFPAQPLTAAPIH